MIDGFVRNGDAVLKRMRNVIATGVFMGAAADGGAQQLVVTVRDSSLRTPVVAAMVTATDQANGTRAYALTNAEGRVNIRLPNPGSWKASVRRIGIVPKSAATVAVARGATVPVQLDVANFRFTLPRVRVAAKAGVCGRAPSGIDRTSALWEQVTLALRSSALARSDSVQSRRLRVRLHERFRDKDLAPISSHVVRVGDGTSRPFFSADTDSLARFGYIRSEPDSMLAYFAPDEVVMLSDAFVRTHCFRTPSADADAALAELEFQPIPRRRVPDIAGVAYVDTASGELRRIVFRYVGAAAFIPKEATHAGGEVSLERLPSGQWIVSDWTIRMPEIVRSSWLTTRTLAGYLESGGSTLSADEARADSLAFLQQLSERDSLARLRGPGDSARVMTNADPSIRRIISPASRAGVPLFFVSARTVEARTRFAQRRAEGEGVFFDSAGIAALGAKTVHELILRVPDVRSFRVPHDMTGPTSDQDLLLAPEWKPGAELPMMALPASGDVFARPALCFPKVLLDRRFTTLSVAELKQLRAVQIATMEVYDADTMMAKASRVIGLNIFSGNVCGRIQLQTYIDYPPGQP